MRCSCLFVFYCVCVCVCVFGRYKQVLAVQSDERMVCRTTQGTGFNHAWTIRVGGQWSTVNKAGTSYGQPIIISYENFPSQIIPDVNDYNTTGGEPIVILGKNLGHLLWKIETASYGMLSDGEFNLDTSSCVIQKPHTELRCYMAPGAGLQMTWRVVVDGQSSVYPTSAYAPPQVHGFSIDTTSVLQSTTSELNSHGGQSIIIHGQNFGPSDTFITKVTPPSEMSSRPFPRSDRIHQLHPVSQRVVSK